MKIRVQVEVDGQLTEVEQVTTPALVVETPGPRALAISGVTHYLDPGFQGAATGSLTAPWKTWPEIVAAVGANASSGQVVCLKAGKPLRVASAIALPAKVGKLIGENGASIRGSEDWSLTTRAWTLNPPGSPAGTQRTACDVTTAVSDTTQDSGTLRVNLAAASYGITDPDAATQWSKHRVLAFVDGAPLAWEDSLAACDGIPTRLDGPAWGLAFAGTFYLDETTHYLYINAPSGITGKLIEWVVAPAILTASGAQVVENLDLRHAHARAQDAAVSINNGATLTHCDVTWSFGRCVNTSSGIINQSRIRFAGQLGLGAFGSASITGNEIAYCNAAQHNIGWEGGAHKSAFSTGVLFADNYVHHNWGEGIWFDWSNARFQVSDNRCDYNRNSGIFCEVNPSGSITGNTCVGNGWGMVYRHVGAGIIVTSSHDIEVTDNICCWNAQGIVVRRSSRNSAEPGVENEVRNVWLRRNQVIQGDCGVRSGGISGGGHGIAWVSDGDGLQPLNPPKIWAAGYGNGGVSNATRHADQASGIRHEWNGATYTDAPAWQNSRAGSTDRVLAVNERDEALAKAFAPATPPARDAMGTLV